MAYTYPTKLAAVAGDVTTLGTLLAQRQSDSGSTNGGIAAAGGSSTVPLLGADAPGLGASYLQAMADCILSTVGYQGQSDALASAWAGTNSATFVDATGFSTWTFTAPVAKTYVLHIDLRAYFSVLTGNGQANFRVVVGSTNYDIASAFVHGGTTGIHLPCSWRIPVAFAAGSNVIKLQAKTDSAGNFIATNTNDARTFTVTG